MNTPSSPASKFTARGMSDLDWRTPGWNDSTLGVLVNPARLPPWARLFTPFAPPAGRGFFVGARQGALGASSATSRRRELRSLPSGPRSCKRPF